MKRNWLVDYLRATTDSEQHRGERIYAPEKNVVIWRHLGPLDKFTPKLVELKKSSVIIGFRAKIYPNYIEVRLSKNHHFNREAIKAHPAIKFLRSRSNILLIDGQNEPEQKKIGLPEVKWRKLHEGIIPRTINREELSTGNVNKK